MSIATGFFYAVRFDRYGIVVRDEAFLRLRYCTGGPVPSLVPVRGFLFLLGRVGLTNSLVVLIGYTRFSQVTLV